MTAEGPTPARSPVRRFGDIKARRTQAMPANSLFGSVLERLRPGEEEALLALDAARLGEVARRYEAPKVRGRPELPLTEAQRQLVERRFGAEVEEWRREFQRQRASLRRTEGRLHELHEHARFRPDHPLDMLPSGEVMRQRLQQPRQRPGQWLTEADLEHAAEVNAVGLRPGAGYDRDRLAQRPPAHRYGLLGDVLRPGMDFDVASRLHADRRPPGPAPAPDNRALTMQQERLEKIRRMPPSTHVIPGSEFEIPANIKHQFGSQLCEDILSDPEKVEETKRRTQSDSAREKKCSSPAKESKVSSSSKDAPCSPGYDMLSTTLRSNVFPGHTRDHHKSSTHRIHDQEVYDRRDAVPDKFRFQWDHVSRWNEANVLHERMKKAEPAPKDG